jgi:hypothetical protein
MSKDEEINRASWPNPDKLGVPLNPHKTELHYIMDGVALWVPYRGRWTLLGRTRDERPSWLIEQSWAEYRGPCPSAEEFAAIKAERDRLRAALQEIAGVMTGPTLHATDMAERMHGLARAALKETSND